MKPCPADKCSGKLKCDKTDSGPDVIIRYWKCPVCKRRFKGTQLPEQLTEIPQADSQGRR